MSLWKSWFVKGFSLALVATLSAELATQIDRANWLGLPALDLGSYLALGEFIMYALTVTLVVSFVVGCLAAGAAFVFGSSSKRDAKSQS
jgi:hypothetical protein